MKLYISISRYFVYTFGKKSSKIDWKTYNEKCANCLRHRISRTDGVFATVCQFNSIRVQISTTSPASSEFHRYIHTSTRSITPCLQITDRSWRFSTRASVNFHLVSHADRCQSKGGKIFTEISFCVRMGKRINQSCFPSFL